MIYLDHNATTTIHPLIKEEWLQYESMPLNASSVHSYGQRGRYIVEEARKRLANLVGIGRNNMRDYAITFTASGTEANNLIMNNFLDGEIFISEIEHPSIFEYIHNHDNVHLIKVCADGRLDLDHFEKLISQNTTKRKLVSVMMANNETGVIQPINEVIKIAKKYDAFVHSDAVQAIGKIKLDLQELDLDFISISAHKFGGMQGVGALIAKTKYHLVPQILGGGQEKSLRSGTEHVQAIHAFGKAAELYEQEAKERYEHMNLLRNKLEAVLLDNFKDIKIVGFDVDRLPNTSLIIHQNHDAKSKLIALDLRGVAVSYGSACSSGKVENSRILKAMGVSDADAKSAIRISVGTSNTESEIDRFLEIYGEI